MNLFLQDLLGNTSQGHPERMSLQLALSQLEQLAEQLNERKREAEQVQAFRSTMRSLSAKLPHAAHHHKSLIRTDDVTQLVSAILNYVIINLSNISIINYNYNFF